MSEPADFFKWMRLLEATWWDYDYRTERPCLSVPLRTPRLPPGYRPDPRPFGQHT